MVLMLLLMHVLAEATPKAIMRTMGVKGLTLFHLKSHLQVSFSIHMKLIYGVTSFFDPLLKLFDWKFSHIILQKYRLGKQSGKDLGEAPKDGRFSCNFH